MKNRNKNKCHSKLDLESHRFLKRQQGETLNQVQGDVLCYNNAFTLIELLVVVLIIGILAAVAVPQYQVAVDKTRAKTALMIMRHIRDAEELYKLSNGNYTMDFTELNLDLPVKSINANKDSITLTDGKTFILGDGGTYPNINAGWSWSTASLYWAINADVFLCYPNGTARGRKLCKSLGCTNADGMYCSFTAAMH